MTFDPNAPNPGQSPGLFPTQNNTNYARLKTIINADHVFNDTAQATDGVHRQVTMISRADPVSLPAGTNSILYSWIDGDGQTQLKFYNGTVDYDITPIAPSPLKITGTMALAGSATSSSVYTIPTNTFGTIFVNYQFPFGTLYRLYGFSRTGAQVNTFVISQSGGSGLPAISVPAFDILLVNGTGSARTILYYIVAESM